MEATIPIFGNQSKYLNSIKSSMVATITLVKQFSFDNQLQLIPIMKRIMPMQQKNRQAANRREYQNPIINRHSKTR